MDDVDRELLGLRVRSLPRRQASIPWAPFAAREVVEIDLAAPVAAQPVALGLVREGAFTLAADLQNLGAGLGFEITRDLIGILRDFSAWSFGKAGR